MLRLSERQQVAVGAAVTILAALVIASAIGLSLWLLARFARAFSSVFLPLAVAAVAALVFRPYFALLRHRLRLPPALALLALFLSVLVPLAATAWFLGAAVVGQAGELIDQAPRLWERLRSGVEERWPRVNDFLEHHPVGRRIKAGLAAQADAVLDGLQLVGKGAVSAGAGMARATGWILTWAVLPVYLAFFLMAEPGTFDRPEVLLPFLKEKTRKDVIYLAREFVNIIVAFFRGQLIIAFLQGLLLAIGFTLVGLRYGFLLGLLLGFLNVVPYLGSILGLGVALPLAFFQAGGGLTKLVAVLVVFAVVQLIEGYLLTPRIMGERTGLHPVAIIVSVFFWGAALDGIMGMILAIPLTAFLVVFWRLAREKYIGEIV